MAALPYMHEFIYALDEKSSDGTRELLFHVKQKYGHEKIVILDTPNFHPHDMGAYNASFNSCIARMTGDAAMFLHPDMLIKNPEVIETMPEHALAWTVHIDSFAGDFQTKITRGRATQWKNIHANKFGLHYYGGYGSATEDFYHRDITGNAYKHYGTEFSKYPFQVVDSGIKINHCCELKDYSRRLEKMKICLKTQNPSFSDDLIDDLATHHPRVTLKSTDKRFGAFEFEKTSEEMPDVVRKYAKEFKTVQGEPAIV